MKITSINVQKRDNNRVNISVDGKYRFSLDTYQLIELGIKIGRVYDEDELVALEQESQFGKIYGRALEYCLMRPHSAREVRQYLYSKTRPKRDKAGEPRPGVAPEITARVFDRLTEKGYVDDQKFARYWIENRSLGKGISQRKLKSELMIKGVKDLTINQLLGETERSDSEEIQKIISKKRPHYPDDKKLTAYLARLGFDYDEIKQAINGQG
ncbi:MAG TPA: RecX family transcriptional regulator [Candidatus Saccharimonadales bacterium]|nr:RecX family transcriptional regulator [Candidatus Saccharimonadales bacterium]